MRFRRKTIALITVGVLGMAVLGVLDMRANSMEPISSSCLASLVTKEPCHDAAPLGMVRFHLDAYRVLVNAVVMTGLTLAFGFLAFGWLLRWLAIGAAAVDAARIPVRPPPWSPHRAVRPWRIQRRFCRWIALHERCDAVACA
ncbi:MAG: hypothetical protein PHI63_00995 [Patescibacteria group bacterium]|nr:hypothetical protein [Patescibacteria group bacterium]